MKMLRLAMLVFLAGLLFSTPVRAAITSFPPEDIEVLDAKSIAALSDQQLIDNYINILAEIEAARAFHTTSGFSVKEYEKYKQIIKYRISLLFEINRRKMEVPQVPN